jgi:ribokinase
LEPRYEKKMPRRIPQVVVIGGTYVDMAIRCGRIPSGGQSAAGSALSYTCTGPGPNQAVEAALCGCGVYLISKVGGDPFGQMAMASLAEFGVSTDFVFAAKAMNTGVVVTLVDALGENAVCSYTGANSALRPEDIDAAEQVIAGADVCLIHGRLPQEAIVSALKCAKVHGTKVILNPARPIESVRGGGGESGALPIEYFSANILIPNLYEAADITDHSAANIRTAKLIGSDMVARGVDSAVITMGKRGCMVVDRASADHIAAFEVELVDQAGRGDAFAGALAAYCAVQDDVRGAAKFASAAGALACTKFGSIEAMPTKAEIIELLQSL